MTDTRDSFVNVKPVIVADAPEAHQVWLDIGVQHFTVGDYCETKEEADWHANQLRHALLSASPGERETDKPAAIVHVDSQGVRFGAFCWVSHEHITGRNAGALNSGKGGIAAVQYMKWLNKYLNPDQAIAGESHEQA